MTGDEDFDPSTLPTKPDVGMEGFEAIDVRVGTVTTVEAFPEARKPAWKVTVDFGPVLGLRNSSAQVTNYGADQLVGRRVVAAVNLGARRIAGFRSEFLLLGALEPDGTVHLLDVDGDVPDGARIA
jgi:tRNA-binding protein